jgi:hypothetical protein
LLIFCTLFFSNLLLSLLASCSFSCFLLHFTAFSGYSLVFRLILSYNLLSFSFLTPYFYFFFISLPSLVSLYYPY